MLNDRPRSPRAVLVFGVAALLGFPPGAGAQEEGAREGETAVILSSADVEKFGADDRHGYRAIPLEDFGRAGFTDVQARHGLVTAVLRGTPLELYVGSPFFRFGRAVRLLANPPYLADGRYWIPASLLTGWTAAAARAEDGRVESGGPAGSSAAAAAEPSAPPRPLRVVIDPGHGGRDPGTTGRRGAREKDVVLAIAKLVHAELARTSGVEAIMTRDRDVLIPLQRRSQLAVAQGGDLFVSIHANASRDRSAQGFETYFLGEARTELSREVAMRENSAVQFEDEGEAPREEDIRFILAQLNLNSYQRESSRLGGFVQNSLRGVLRAPDRGVKQNVFWVLVGSTGSMPSILVEIGFLSNEQEEKLLRSQAGQQRVASAIVEAIVAYRDDYAPRLQAAGAR